MKKRLLYFGLLLCLLLPNVNSAQSLRNLPFSWDNVTIYFLITDRFNNGDTTNDTNFDRLQDSQNNELDFHGGDIPGATQKIREGYFDELGVSAIWVTPVVENRHGFNNPPADDPGFRDYPYHGYHTNDWTAFDPNFTSAAQFEEFIDEAHNHGIRVLVDIVMNHSGYRTYKSVDGTLEFADEDYPNDWVRLQCGTDNGELPCDDLTTPLFGLPDIRTESSDAVTLPQWLLDKWEAEGRKQQELDELDAYFTRTGKSRAPKYYLIKWLTDWVREYGIDGFRVDTERHVGVDVWAELKDEAVLALREWKLNNPAKKLDDLDFYMTGEHSGVNIIGNVGDQLPDDFTVGKFNSMINFRSPKEAYTDLTQEQIFSSFAAKLNDNDNGFGSQGEYNMVSYLRSHDFSEFYTGDMFYGGTTLLLSPGGVQIYYGDESGREFFNAQTYIDAGYRGDMNWDSLDEGMLFHWRKLGTFRREHTSVGAGSHQKLSDAPYIFKREYNRNGENDKVLVFQGQDGDFFEVLNVFGMWPDGTELKDYFSDQTAIVSGGTVTFGTTFGLVLVGEPLELSDSVSLSVNPASGVYTSPVNVEMTASSTVQGASVNIFYTTDGSTPSASSISYTSLVVDATVTVKAIAIDSEGNESSVITRDYVIGDGGPFDIHFKKPSDWSSAFVYLFNQNTGEALPGFPGWPGAAMQKEGDSPWYKYTVDQNVQVGIVFNDNGGAQTDDTTRIKEGWYDTQWRDTCSGECPGDIIDTSYDVYFKKPNSWNTAFVYIFNKNTGAALPGFPAWPGVAMETVNNTPWFKYTIDQSVEVGIVFNDNGGVQTDDLFRNTDGWYDTQWTDNCPGDCPGVVIDTSFDVYFKKPVSWSSAFIYIYDKNANTAIPGAPTWPGEAMSAISGSPWYSYTIDESVEVGIVFNDNGSAQTDDLSRTSDGWYNTQWFEVCPSECPASGGLQTAQTKSQNSSGSGFVKAFPNPFENTLSLSFAGDMSKNSVRLALYDLAGKRTKLIPDQEIKTNQITLNTEELPKGIYMIRITSINDSKIIKLVK